MFIWYLDQKLQDRIPGLSKSSRESFETGVVEQMANLVTQMKNAKTLDDALELIKAAVIVAWGNVVNGSISLDEATLVNRSSGTTLFKNFKVELLLILVNWRKCCYCPCFMQHQVYPRTRSSCSRIYDMDVRTCRPCCSRPHVTTERLDCQGVLEKGS